MTADVDMKVMLAGYNRTDGDKTAYYAPSDTDPATVSAFDLAFVTKIGDTDQPKPYGYVTANDISLANKGSVTLMIPGAVGAMYWINGGLDGVIKDVSVISVDRIGGTLGSDEKPITLNTDNVAKYPSSTTPQLPLSQANAYNYWLYGGLTGDTILHFGEAYICKITDATGNLLRVDGDIQAFKSLEDGFKAYKDNALNAYTTKDNTPAAPAYIKMLVEDYDLKLDRVVSDYKNSIAAPVNKPLILTTASSDDEELPGPYKGTEATRCVINRGAISKGSTFSVPKNANLTTENIIFDGDAEFEDDIYKSGEVAVNGVIVNVASGGTLTLGEGTTMRNSAVKSDANKGGAIYADKDSILSITGTPTNWVTFMDCQAKGGGAINNPGDNGFGGTVAIEYCSFSHCYAKGRDDTNASGPCAGGAVRCMANTLTLSHCVFSDCSTVQQGGALYHKGGTEFNAEYCTFTRCSCYDPQKSVQAAAGGAESQAKTVTVDYCTFTECTSSKNAGGFNVFNTGATINVKNSKFVGCSANGKKEGQKWNPWMCQWEIPRVGLEGIRMRAG